jgi:hypothetical protein
MFIPDPDLYFLPIPVPDQGITKTPDRGSGSATLVYGYRFWFRSGYGFCENETDPVVEHFMKLGKLLF